VDWSALVMCCSIMECTEMLLWRKSKCCVMLDDLEGSSSHENMKQKAEDLTLLRRGLKLAVGQKT